MEDVPESNVPANDGRSRESDAKKSSVHESEPQVLTGSKRAAPKAGQEYGFAHPAASRPQRTVWIPKDTLGLGEEEERACQEAGVDVSVSNATMNEKGKVAISGAPPDLVQED